MSFFEDLIKEMGGPIAEQLGQREGLSQDQSKGVLESLAPVILSGLKRKKDQGIDLENLVQGLGGREESLSNPGSFFDGPMNVGLDAGGILGLENGSQAAEAIAKKNGIGVDVARKILPMLIPVVLAFLMKRGKEDSATPDRRSGLNAILDRDGDGAILDDIAGMVLAGKIGGQGKKGFLAMLLSFFLGRK